MNTKEGEEIHRMETGWYTGTQHGHSGVSTSVHGVWATGTRTGTQVLTNDGGFHNGEVEVLEVKERK